MKLSFRIQARTIALSLSLTGSLLVAGTARAADGPVEKVSVRAVANFGFDQATLRPQDRSQLLAEVGKMKDVTWQTVRAIGHTDSVGPDAYNLDLSSRRARAVKAYLQSQGLPSDMVRTEAKASAAPLASNETPEGRAKNRRTEIEFQGVRVSAR